MRAGDQKEMLAVVNFLVNKERAMLKKIIVLFFNAICKVILICVDERRVGNSLRFLLFSHVGLFIIYSS